MDMDRMIMELEKFYLDEDGASAVEYAVLAASIIAVLVLTILVLGGKTKGLYEMVSDIWNSVDSPPSS